MLLQLIKLFYIGSALFLGGKGWGLKFQFFNHMPIFLGNQGPYLLVAMGT